MRIAAGSILALALADAATAATVRFNELLANSPAPWLEIANGPEGTVDLAGWEIRSGTGPDRRWTFGPDWQIAPGSLLLLPKSLTGLECPALGGHLELRLPDGSVADALDYGPQLPSESVGWTAGRWQLQRQPSPGQANGAAAPVTSADGIRLNEWKSEGPGSPGWIELYNPSALPADLAGSQIGIDRDDEVPRPYAFPDLSWIAPYGWLLLSADPTRPGEPANLGFGLGPAPGFLVFHGPGGGTSDRVPLFIVLPGEIAGRLPDGGGFVGPLSAATPDGPNDSTLDFDSDGMPDGWEARYELNPADPSDADDDPDGDGLDNRAEYAAGRNPRASDPPLPVSAEPAAGNNIRLRFVAAEGMSYSVLAGPAPDSLGELLVPFIADGPERTVEVTDRTDGARFYRIVAPARAAGPDHKTGPGISRR